jgi:hypothetical protein
VLHTAKDGIGIDVPGPDKSAAVPATHIDRVVHQLGAPPGDMVDPGRVQIDPLALVFDSGLGVGSGILGSGVAGAIGEVDQVCQPPLGRAVSLDFARRNLAMLVGRERVRDQLVVRAGEAQTAD